MRIYIVSIVLLALSEVNCQLDLAELLEQQQQQQRQLQQRRQGGGGQNGGISGMINMISSGVRNRIVEREINRALRFIVHPTAQISPELLQFGNTLGRAPRSKEERDVFSELMKQVGRKTPALLRKYVIDEKHKNGTVTEKIDYYGVEADIIRRGLLFQRMRRAPQEYIWQLEQQLHYGGIPFVGGLSLTEAQFGGPTTLAPQAVATTPNITISLLDILSQNGTNNNFGTQAGLNNQQGNIQSVTASYDYGSTTGFFF